MMLHNYYIDVARPTLFYLEMPIYVGNQSKVNNTFALYKGKQLLEKRERIGIDSPPP